MAAAVTAEGVNILMLAYQHTIADCIIFFAGLKVIMKIGDFYLNSLMDNPLEKVMDKPVRIIHRGVDIKFSERTMFNKVARVIYKLLRGIYVGIIFYFAPFLVVYIQWGVEIKDDHTCDDKSFYAKWATFKPKLSQKFTKFLLHFQICDYLIEFITMRSLKIW